jgi:integrase
LGKTRGRHEVPFRQAHASRPRPILSPKDHTDSPSVAVNKMAKDGYSKSAVKPIRTYLRACFEYDSQEPRAEASTGKHPQKPCERFLSIAEAQALRTAASPREHLVLRILAACGLRPGEALALRLDDFEGNQPRFEEALKERQLGEDHIGDTKTDERDSYVPIPPDLSREISFSIGYLRHSDPAQQKPRHSQSTNPCPLRGLEKKSGEDRYTRRVVVGGCRAGPQGWH